MYHINPTTKRVGICRATKQCPFGGDEIHFETKELATAHSVKELPLVSSVKKKKLSAGARLVLELGKAQEVIISKARNGIPREDDLNFWKDITTRNDLQNRLEREIPWDDSDAPLYDDDELVQVEPTEFIADSSRRNGFSNDFLRFGPQEDAIYSTLDESSRVWLNRLSTAEVKAIIHYNLSADAYAKIQAGVLEPSEEQKLYIKYFHSAMEKAPRTSSPYVVYSGVSSERKDALAEQAETGMISLERIQSASLNPAQVNQFSHYNADEAVVLELKLNRIASLSLFNIHRGEMEVLAPPGAYEVSRKLENVEYFWNETSGRKMGRTYQADFTG